MVKMDSTFTIVAVDCDEREKGVAICTYRPAVGNRAPYARSGAGAVSTQAHTNPDLGPRVLDLLGQGQDPDTVLEIVLEDDPDRERRQVLCVDARGRGAAFTGQQTQGWKGHHVGEHYVVGGNMLAGPQVLEDMGAAFEETVGSTLYERMLAALTAGRDAGGDRRGCHSAALIVAKPGIHPYLDLRVDFDNEPLEKLELITAEYIKRMLN